MFIPGLGIGLSNAHFLHANPKTYERVEGMNPKQEKHGSRIVIDPVSTSNQIKSASRCIPRTAG